MAGLLTGAMAGLGQGISGAGDFLLRAKADEIKEQRLQQYELAREQRQNQRQDRIRDEDREWTLEDYTRQRSDAVEDRDVQFEQQKGLLQMREAGADRRASMQISARQSEGREDWQMMPTQDGRYIQYSPSRNEYRDANLPEGVSAGGDKLTDRQKRELDFIEDEIKSIRESSTDEMGIPRQPTESETQHLQSLLSQREAIMGGGNMRRQPGGEPTILESLLAGEGSQSGDSEPQAPVPSAPGGAAPPRPGSADAYIESRRQHDESVQSEANADDEVQELAGRARRVANWLRMPEPLQPSSPGLLQTERPGRDEAVQLLESVTARYDSETNPQRKAMLKRSLDALYDAGVTAP